MVSSTNAAAATAAPSNGYRWMQLIIGVVCMAMIANLQYGWTYFVGPMAKAHSWDVGSIQVAFSIFVALLFLGEHRGFGGLENAVEATQNGERQDHLTVLRLLVVAAQEIGD